MKHDKSKWLVPLFSFAIYLCWLYILYLIDYNYKGDMKGFVFGMILLGYLGAVLLIIGYLFIPVTQYFYEKGKEVFSIFVAMICLLPSLGGSWLLNKGDDFGKTFLVILMILSGFNIPYFLTLILILKDKSNDVSDFWEKLSSYFIIIGQLAFLQVHK